MRKNHFILLTLTLFCIHAQAQYRYPLDIPAILSANFAELRPNHFHSGIDLKTQNVINKTVYSIESGYISRISISPSGYGLALYVNHPDGNTSVYAHLNGFPSQLAEYIKKKQYELEKYNIDITLEPEIYPVKKGDIIAYSGNTGSSFGPHVHFEIRKNNAQEAIDPLTFYKNQIEDTEKPVIKGIAIYPIEGFGSVNNSPQPLRQGVITGKGGEYSKLKQTINAWGKIGIGINAIDKMNGTANIYGVKKVRLSCDGKVIFSSDINSFRFDQTRMINSMCDYEYWTQKKSFYMKSFVEQGNKLPFYQTTNGGYVQIDQEREYAFRYDLEDMYGNATSYQFSINGKRQAIPPYAKCSQVMSSSENNYYITDSFSIIIPKDYLYTDIGFITTASDSKRFYSPVFSVHNKPIPLNGYCDLKIKVKRDSLLNKAQYGIVKINGEKQSWIGGSYNNGYMNAQIRELGDSYAVGSDITPPTITPVAPQNWAKQGKITLKMSDNKSGIKSYKGTIDGNFVLFEHDSKSPLYVYKFDTKRLKKGQTHKFAFTVIDKCDNRSTYEYEFKY